MATALKALKESEKSIQAFEMALRIRQKSLGDQHPLTAQVQLELARQFASVGNLVKSRELAKAAVAVFETCFGASHASTEAAQRLATQ